MLYDFFLQRLTSKKKLYNCISQLGVIIPSSMERFIYREKKTIGRLPANLG